MTAESAVRAAIHQLLVDAPPDRTSAQAFAEARFERGLAWVWFPEGYGGLGVERDWQGLVDTELLESGASQLPRNVLGTHMGAPTIMEHGNELQRRQWLRRIYTSGEIWCQLFSEPGAGSDLGGLATRASYNGVEWQVTGQKVWTTSAFGAKWGLLVARTNPDVVKHEGITFFILDMHQPGVEVRPLRQMNGEAEFNEVFLTDARIPDDQRIGQAGAGWSVLLSTLMNERLVFVSNDGPSGGTRPAERVVQALRAAGSAGPAQRDRAVRLWVDVECNRLLNLRTSQLRAFHEPGPDGSLLKLAVTELNQRVSDFCVDVMGAAAMVMPTGYPAPGEDVPIQLAGHPVFGFLRSRANTIEGGTSEMHRNQVGERVLRLPREPRADKGVPWRSVPRN